ncbi:MAG: GNAT family N-acetyltransferase [Chloroflexi bacterium]|nr:GNAT family N-acetyltransferase [Chloroflexota bacterium]MDL1882683.1 GNAT family N-acetyltransferase [Anaerolineae bacterium CFX8]
MSVEVRKVENRDEFKALFEFPWTLYKGDPYWVPPLLSMRRDLLDKQHNPAWAEYLEGDFFTARRDGRLVGTIAAYINHRHNQFHNQHIGWFGLFEVYDDQEAAAALLETAAEWVRERGYDAIRGPQTFTTHEDVGVLVDGFARPVLLMPYNYPYYSRLIEGAGFQKAMDVYSFHLSRQGALEHKTGDRLKRLTEAVMKRNKITVRKINPQNLKAEFELFKELYNAAWDKNWGFVPMTPRELDVMVKSLGQFFDPDKAFFAEVAGEPAGFVMAVPDFNQVLHRVYPRPGVPEVFSLLKALWHWKIRPVIDTARIPLMGVKEAYREKGVAAVLYYYVLEALLADPRIQHSDSGWILEVNENMVSIALSFGSDIYRTYRLYEKSLNSTE